MDTDEKMEKSLNPFVEKDIAFMGFEDGKVLSMGVMGFPPKHHIIAELLEYYNQPFSMDIITQNTSNVVIVTNYLAEKYRLKTDNSEQLIGDVHIYPRTYFKQWTFLETGIKLPIPLLYIYIWDRGFLMKPNKSLTAEKMVLEIK